MIRFPLWLSNMAMKAMAHLQRINMMIYLFDVHIREKNLLDVFHLCMVLLRLVYQVSLQTSSKLILCTFGYPVPFVGSRPTCAGCSPARSGL